MTETPKNLTTLDDWIAERDFCEQVIATDKYINPIVWQARLKKAEDTIQHILLNEERMVNG